MFFFFFSSRRRHTRFDCDWSSDVCSSDLVNRAPMFYIYGQVQKPGQYRLERGMTVIQALATGGGVTGKGTQRGIVRHRRDPSGKVKEEGVTLDEDVQDQDVIYVKESLF